MSDEPQVEILQDAIIEGVPQPEVALVLETGYLLMEMGHLKDAEVVFEGVAALLPKSDVPRVALGNLFFAQGKLSRALKHHQEALKVRPESALAQAHIGETLLFLKKTDEGLKAVRASLEMEPEGSAAAFAQALLDAHEAGELE